MRKQLVTTVLAVAWTVGCGGDGTGTTSEDVLSLTTDAQQIRVRIDGSTTLDVGLSGAVGAVEVAVEGLPVGLTAEPVSVDDGGDTAQLTLSAAASAEMAGPLALQVVATDEEGGTDSLELPLYVAGAPGALDTSFSFDGQATYRPTDREYDACRDLLLDSHSRLVVSGVGQGANPWRGWVARFEPDGSIDETFADEGVLVDFGDESTTRGVALRGEDALVVLSSWPDQTGEGTLGLRGLTVDGQTDTEFGTAGWVESADSRNVVATPTGFVTHGFGAMASFDVTGTPDSGFASASPLNVTSVAADDDGRLLVGGVSDGMHYAVQRLHPDGGLDGTFGTAGTLSILLPPFAGKDAVIYDLRSMGDAGGVAVGSSNVGGLSENIPVLIRFDTDGEVDAGFGSGGLADVLESGELGGVDIVRVQSDGRLLVVGYLHEGGFDTTPLLLRFNPDGSPDTTFGANGRFELAQFPRDIAIDAGAERVLVLADQEGGQGGVLLTRIWL